MLPHSRRRHLFPGGPCRVVLCRRPTSPVGQGAYVRQPLERQLVLHLPLPRRHGVLSESRTLIG